MEPRDLAFIDWQNGMKYKAIADKYGVTLSAVKSWATRDWKHREVATNPKEKLQPKSKKLQPKKQVLPTPSPAIEAVANAVEENEELTEKQKQFCVFFLTNFNATQAYLKAYGCSYEAANASGPRMLVNVSIQKEIQELKKIKNAALGNLCSDDVVELHMRIAFANINDFMEFKGKTAPVMHKGKVVTMEHPKTGQIIPVTETVNDVRLKDSTHVDGQLINEVSQSKDGIKIKRADQQRSLSFLERYFWLNPMDRHRKEYDSKRLELEERKVKQAEGDGSDHNEPVRIILERAKCQK